MKTAEAHDVVQWTVRPIDGGDILKFIGVILALALAIGCALGWLCACQCALSGQAAQRTASVPYFAHSHRLNAWVTAGQISMLAPKSPKGFIQLHSKPAPSTVEPIIRRA